MVPIASSKSRAGLSSNECGTEKEESMNVSVCVNVPVSSGSCFVVRVYICVKTSLIVASSRHTSPGKKVRMINSGKSSIGKISTSKVNNILKFCNNK